MYKGLLGVYRVLMEIKEDIDTRGVTGGTRVLEVLGLLTNGAFTGNMDTNKYSYIG